VAGDERMPQALTNAERNVLLLQRQAAQLRTHEHPRIASAAATADHRAGAFPNDSGSSDSDDAASSDASESDDEQSASAQPAQRLTGRKRKMDRGQSSAVTSVGGRRARATVPTPGEQLLMFESPSKGANLDDQPPDTLRSAYDHGYAEWLREATLHHSPSKFLRSS
jgi:hypothetical protein